MAMLAVEQIEQSSRAAKRDRGAGIHSVASGAGFWIYAVVRGTFDKCFRQYPWRGAGYRWLRWLVPRSVSTRTRGSCVGRSGRRLCGHRTPCCRTAASGS